MKRNLTDPLSAFQSPSRNRGKIITDEPKHNEAFEQLTFCKWLKNTYPDILFRSDIQAGTKKSGQMQNIVQILDPYSGWPDVTIYSLNLMIEMKRIGAQKSGEHWRNQQAMHEQLRKVGWRVEVAFGAEQAKKIFLEYINF